MTLLRLRSARALAAATALLSTSAIATSVLAQSFNDKKPISYSVDGATATGYFKVVAETINAIVREAYPGSDATYKPGSPAGGILNLSNGKSEFTFTGGGPEIEFALEGKAPFKESLKGKFSFMMMMHDELVVHALMTKEFSDRAGVRSYDDIVAKKPAMRLGVNTTGNLQSTYGMYLLHFGAYGIGDAQLAKWGVTLFRGNTNEGLSQMRDGKIDMLVNGAFLPTAEVIDINRGRPLVWVEGNEEKMKSAVGKYGYRVVKLEKGGYPFVERDTFMTVNWNAGLVGNHVSEETVYKFLKAITDAKDKVQKVHPSLAKFSKETIARNPTSLPLHPGAQRFYKEAGVIK